MRSLGNPGTIEPGAGKRQPEPARSLGCRMNPDDLWHRRDGPQRPIEQRVRPLGETALGFGPRSRIRNTGSCSGFGHDQSGNDPISV